MFKFNIKKNFSYLAKKQITQLRVDPDFYLKMSKSEYKAIRAYIERPNKILELGCGLGRMSIFLNHKLTGYNPHFILADVSKESSNTKYGWNPKGSYYNDLELTADFAKQHGLDNFVTFDLLSDDLSSLKDVDLVMSFLSVGFHYPIDQYLKTLLDITSNNCTMIFGVRKGKYNTSDYLKYFKNIYIEKNSVRSKEDILILKNKK